MAEPFNLSTVLKQQNEPFVCFIVKSPKATTKQFTPEVVLWVVTGLTPTTGSNATCGLYSCVHPHIIYYNIIYIYKATQHSTDDSKPRKLTLVEIKPSAFYLGFASLHIIMRLWVSSLMAVTAVMIAIFMIIQCYSTLLDLTQNHLFLFDAKSHI